MAKDISNSNDALRPDSNLYLLNSFRKLKGNHPMSMSQQLAPAKNSEIQIDDRTFLVLKNNLYKEAKSDDSIKMVINYCVSRNIDPLLKAVHIVPMWNKDKQAYEDTIMPGIGLYRIIAARNGQYAGLSEPVFGPMVTDKLGSITITYPESCTIIVRKFMHGQIVEFVAKEYWIENYASVKKNDLTPNTMWQKRKFGQLAKCAEAQALRKAFPEVGHDYTYEELQGKTFDQEYELPKNLDVVKSLPLRQAVVEQEVEYDQDAFIAALADMDNCKDKNELRSVFTKAYKNPAIVCDAKSKNELIRIKDLKLADLSKPAPDYVDIDITTGEVMETETCAK